MEDHIVFMIAFSFLFLVAEGCFVFWCVLKLRKIPCHTAACRLRAVLAAPHRPRHQPARTSTEASVPPHPPVFPAELPVTGPFNSIGPFAPAVLPTTIDEVPAERALVPHPAGTHVPDPAASHLPPTASYHMRPPAAFPSISSGPRPISSRHVDNQFSGACQQPQVWPTPSVLLHARRSYFQIFTYRFA